MQPSMYCNGDCLKWTKNYNNIGDCNECGKPVLPYGFPSLGEGKEPTPDLEFEGTWDDWMYAKKDLIFPDLIRMK